MPTELPDPRRPSPPDRDPGFRNVVVAAVLLIGTIALICGRYYPPLSAYALTASPAELQLSP